MEKSCFVKKIESSSLRQQSTHFFQNNFSSIFPFILSFLLVGCAIKRDHYDVPKVLLSDQYRHADLFPKAGELATAPDKSLSDKNNIDSSAKPINLDEWWRSLGSNELNGLVDQALANNTDLRITMLRLAQLQARANQADAALFPTITSPFEAHQDSPPNGINSATTTSPTAAKHREYYQAALRGDWRVDLWGELSSMAESAEMQLWQATYKNNDAHRLLIANVVSKYIEYLSLNDRIRVARETEAALHEMLDAINARVEAGDATVIDLEQQRSSDYAVHATIPALELQREMAAHAIALLVEVTPSALALSYKGMDSLTFPGAMQEIPSSLLLRRPDIRAVEAKLLAADADIDVARARLFPPLNLTSQGSYGLLAYGQFFGPYGLLYTAVGNLTATIFDHGKRSQDVAFAHAMHEELVETYLHTVYLAVRETEDALANTYMNGKRLEAQKIATDAAQRAWLASKESYQAGGVDFLTLNDTERTYHRALDEYHHIRQQRFDGLVSLYSALGGGVPQYDVLPSDNLKLKASSIPTPSGIDWIGRTIDTDKEFWLVELSGLQDRSGVIHAWRDLQQRFSSQMTGRVALPRLQGKVAKKQQESATWYRVFIARFSNEQEAGSFCVELATKQVRCQVVSSGSDAFNNFIEDDSVNIAKNANSPTEDSKWSILNWFKQPSSDTTTPPENVPSKSIQEAPALLTEFKKKPETEKNSLSLETKITPVGYAVQMETMSNQSNAENAALAWSRKGYQTYIQQVRVNDGRIVYALRTGNYPTRKEASVQADAFRKNKGIEAIPVLINPETAGKGVTETSTGIH